uniref:Uncharacterized protein n=1 Tax=Oryza meridionalis TaxID=40149 RepID=A0A0E0F9Z7_9ORYZ
MGEGIAIATAARDGKGSRCPASVARSPAAPEEDGDRGREVAIAIAAVAAAARGRASSRRPASAVRSPVAAAAASNGEGHHPGCSRQGRAPPSLPLLAVAAVARGWEVAAAVAATVIVTARGRAGSRRLALDARSPVATAAAPLAIMYFMRNGHCVRDDAAAAEVLSPSLRLHLVATSASPRVDSFRRANTENHPLPLRLPDLNSQTPSPISTPRLLPRLSPPILHAAPDLHCQDTVARLVDRLYTATDLTRNNME